MAAMDLPKILSKIKDTDDEFSDLTAVEKEELKATMAGFRQGEIDSNILLDKDFGFEEPEDEREDRTPGIRRALKSLARAKGSNKRRFLAGKKEGFKLGGKSVTRATFLKKIGGTPSSWKAELKKKKGDDFNYDEWLEKTDAQYDHVAVVRSRDDFVGGSFETDWDADVPKGVWIVKGAIDDGSVNADDMLIQRYEFSNTQWTPDQAKKWLDQNNIEYKKFIPAEKDPKVDSDVKKDRTRVDYINITEEPDNFMAEKFQMNNDGFLKGRAVVTNVGVFMYRNADGSVTRELRPPEEVFDFDSLKSLEMVPLTNSHPSVKVDSENIKELQVGHTGDSIRTDSYRVSAPLVVTDPEVIGSIQTGKKAISCGYMVDLEERSGNWMGVPYDVVQRNIRYNHIAVNIDRGRAGDDAVIKLDSVDAVGVDMDNTQISREDNMPNFKKVKLDGVEYEAEAKVIETLHSTQEELKTKTDEVDAVKADKSTIEAERDSLKDENEQLKKDKEALEKTAPEKIDEAVQTRLELLKNAGMAEVEVKDEMKEDEIKKAIILKAFPKAAEKLDEADEAYINARYDAAVEYLEERKQQDASNKNKGDLSDVSGSNGDSKDRVDSEKARQDMIERAKRAYVREEK